MAEIFGEKMYKKKDITLKELFKQGHTGENSLKALRSRANEGILIYTGIANDGRTRLYDKQLSIVRSKAARQCKNNHPQPYWSHFKRAFMKLDELNPSLNNLIINLLNKQRSENQAIIKILEYVCNQLRSDGHID